MIVTKQVTNNLIDVFYGRTGWDRKEHVRMKRGPSTWIPVGTSRRTHQDEFDWGCILPLEPCLPAIQEILNREYKSKR